MRRENKESDLTVGSFNVVFHLLEERKSEKERERERERERGGNSQPVLSPYLTSKTKASTMMLAFMYRKKSEKKESKDCRFMNFTIATIAKRLKPCFS